MQSQLITQVWKEVCRHLDIRESVDRLRPILAKSLPLMALAVRRIELQRGCIETVARSTAGSGERTQFGKTSLNDDQMKQVLTWIRQGRVSAFAATAKRDVSETDLSRLIGGADDAAMLAGPLASEDGTPLGALLFVARPRVSFTKLHATTTQELMEPFAAAMENDSRLREMRAMREALEADNRALLSRLDRQDITDTVVGEQTGLKDVMDRVDQVASSDVPVLILGETGSGKEVIARAIHARSKRRAGPILRVNCGAIPPELIDSELFGHERGSFTGAAAMRKGWFERADGGTLFLDEIGELPLAAQVRMLRILQDGSFERVGGQNPLTADVRIVAATHADLHVMVAQGRFREDLWYRISVFPIHLPPLRQRKADIPAFAAHLAARSGKRLGGHELVPTAQDTVLLQAYSWPGNVRELAAVIERAAILGDGRRLEIARALGLAAPPVGPSMAAALTPPPVSAPTLHPEDASFSSLNDLTIQHIEAALIRSLGRISGPFGAAKLLGINPDTLRSRMRKMRIDWKRFRNPINL
jgi:hydrogenase-4 transcriptional activator